MPPKRLTETSAHEILLVAQLLQAKLWDGWQRQVRFHPTRRWRFDIANEGLKLAVEIDGGTWSRGRHTRGAGFQEDCEKVNSAILLGWRVLRFTGRHVSESEYALDTIRAAMRQGRDT